MLEWARKFPLSFSSLRLYFTPVANEPLFEESYFAKKVKTLTCELLGLNRSYASKDTTARPKRMEEK